MRKVHFIVLAAVAIYLLAAMLALAQGGNPPASTKESGQTSRHGMTAAEQTYKGNVEQQIKTLWEEGRQAVLKGDTSFQEKYLADDYIGIGGDGRMEAMLSSLQVP
jgi:Spy/CpxP family protein refolding chaperone